MTLGGIEAALPPDPPAAPPRNVWQVLFSSAKRLF
jgi:hypothetical protein